MAWIRLLTACMLMMTVAACVRYSLIQPQRTTIQNSFSVEPSAAWNKINLQQTAFAGSYPVEAWTADGDKLNMLLFFAGVADGQALLPPSGNADNAKKQPLFRSGMNANEVKDLFEATLGQFVNSALVETRNLRPTSFGGREGYRFDFTLVGKDEVERQGIAAGTIAGGKFYGLVFMGTRLYHYSLRLPDAEQMLSSVRFVSAGSSADAGG